MVSRLCLRSSSPDTAASATSARRLGAVASQMPGLRQHSAFGLPAGPFSPFAEPASSLRHRGVRAGFAIS